MTYLLALAAGFMVGFVVPTRAMVLLLVPVAVIAVEIGYAMLFDAPTNAIFILIDIIIIAYPTGLSINHFMHD